MKSHSINLHNIHCKNVKIGWAFTPSSNEKENPKIQMWCRGCKKELTQIIDQSFCKDGMFTLGKAYEKVYQDFIKLHDGVIDG